MTLYQLEFIDETEERRSVEVVAYYGRVKPGCVPKPILDYADRASTGWSHCYFSVTHPTEYNSNGVRNHGSLKFIMRVEF